MDHLDSKNLVPFRKRRNGYRLPGLTKQVEEQVIDEVDPELRPEEQGYVRHYLSYADVMLKNSPAAAEEPEENRAPAAAENTGNAARESAEAETAAPAEAPAENMPAENTNVAEMPQRRATDSKAA